MLTSMKHPSPHILLINPWITDFAAYNFWIKPLGLLHIASLLRECGYKVTLIDCLDQITKKKRYGDGNFLKTKIETLESLKIVPRFYSQYGMSEETLLEKFSSIENPDVICFTSGMTYWYPGLFKSIRMARDFFKGAPVLLGGIYATLCREHASKYSGADFIIEGRGELEALESFLNGPRRNPHGPCRAHGMTAVSGQMSATVLILTLNGVRSALQSRYLNLIPTLFLTLLLIFTLNSTLYAWPLLKAVHGDVPIVPPTS